jgi:hypothetical protein
VTIGGVREELLDPVDQCLAVSRPPCMRHRLPCRSIQFLSRIGVGQVCQPVSAGVGWAAIFRAEPLGGDHDLPALRYPALTRDGVKA